MSIRLLFLVKITFAFFLESIEMFRVEHVQFVTLFQDDLSKSLKVNFDCHWKNTVFVRCILQMPHHHLKVRLRDILAFEQDSLRNALHAVFYQELVHVSAFILEKVVGCDLCEHKFNVKFCREALVFAKLENSFL